MLTVLAQALPEVGGTDLMDGVTAATVLGLIVALVRVAVGAHDKRATVAETRETRCTTALEATNATIGALTTEVRADGDGFHERLTNLEHRLGPMERGIAELLDYARRR